MESISGQLDLACTNTEVTQLPVLPYPLEQSVNCRYLNIHSWVVNITSLFFLQIRVSAVISNAPYMLNVDCDHYINNSKALRESMCFMMDPTSGKKICYVQFPQRFDGIDRHDRYSNRNVVFFDVRAPFTYLVNLFQMKSS